MRGGPEIIVGVRGPKREYTDAWAEVAERALGKAGALAGLSARHELSLTVCDSAFMRVVNRRWRGQDKATDVLSFPQHEMEEGEVPPSGPVGDVVIALPVVRRAAEELGVDPMDHLRHLAVHGLLHLLGYDHARSAAGARRL